MKTFKLFALILLIVTGSCAKQILKVKAAKQDKDSNTYELVFVDEFDKDGSFDTNKWTYAERWHPAWAKYLTASADYVKQSQGNLLLRMDDAVIEGDPVPYHSGGIQTTQKFSFKYGKVEARAKFNQGQGSWPAIWMMPETPVSYGDWPNSGEIDIMEHVGKEEWVHQTVHNAKLTDAEGASSATHKTNYEINGYNTYGIVWEPTKIEFFVNDQLQYTYHKPQNATAAEWPYDQAFYLILNQSGGAGWPGPIVKEDLPFEMEVDYIRVYQTIVK